MTYTATIKIKKSKKPPSTGTTFCQCFFINPKAALEKSPDPLIEVSLDSLLAPTPKVEPNAPPKPEFLDSDFCVPSVDSFASSLDFFLFNKSELPFLKAFPAIKPGFCLFRVLAPLFKTALPSLVLLASSTPFPSGPPYILAA